MPQIPLPPSQDRGTFGQRAASIPELTVRATPEAFGSGAAEATYRGQMQMVGNIASAAAAEGRMWNAAIGGVIKEAGEWWQKEQRLEAEANLHKLQLGMDDQAEGENATPATGDGSHRTRTLATFDERAQHLIDNAQTPYQSGIYREAVQRLRFQAERAAVAREVAAVRAQREENLRTVIEGAEVGVFRDPATLGARRDEVLSTIAGSNLTAAQRNRLTQDVERRFTSMAIQRHLLNNRPDLARALMSDDRTIRAVGGADALRLESSILQHEERAREQAEIRQYRDDLIAGRRLANPTSENDRRMVDRAFADMQGPQHIASMNADVIPNLVTMVRTTGIMPPGASNTLTAMALEGTDEQRIFALQVVSAVERASPGTLETSGAHRMLRERAEYWATLTNGENGGLGLDNATALARLNERMTPAFRARMEARKAQTDQEIKNRTEDELRTAFGSFWNSISDIGNTGLRSSILQSYRESYRYHVTNTDNENEAQQAAIRDMRRQYGITRLSGGDAGRLVRNPIEMRLPPVGDAPLLPTSRDTRWDWVRNQAVAEIKRVTGTDVAPEDVIFEATPATDRAVALGGWNAGHIPPYAMSWRVRRPDGTYEPRNRTIPGQLFTPDLVAARTAELERVNADRARQIELDEARRARLRTPPTLGGPRPARPRPERRSEVNDNDRQTLADLFGWGARVAGSTG